MARKVGSFKVDTKKKIITIYTNVEASAAEKELKEWYLSQGYEPKTDIKKQGVTVEQMRKELAKDEKTLAAFNAAYAEKNGFFNACKIYTGWKKNK